MRISVENSNLTQRVLIVAAIAVTFPISAPLITVLILWRELKKRKLKKIRNGPIAVLRENLWGGFGQATSAEILICLSEGRFRPKERAELCYELARWQAAQADWIEVLDLLDQATTLNPRILHKSEPTALRLEAEFQMGKLDTARLTLNRAEKILGPTEFFFSESNYLLLAQGDDATAERLALLNRIYTAAGLSPVGLIDPDGPLDIDNLIGLDVTSVQRPEKVSVIFPVFKAADHLDTAIRSMRAQSYTNLEIIMIDDASPDDSWAVIQRHAAEDDRIVALQNSENIYAYRTRNRGLHRATGEFVTAHDSDDWSHPDMIARQVERFAQSNVRGVFGTAVRVKQGCRTVIDPQRPDLKFMRRCYPAFMARREELLALGGWDEVRVGADGELVQRLSLKHGDKSVDTLDGSAPLTLQRTHDASLTQTTETSFASQTYGLRKTYSIQQAHWRQQQIKSDESLKIKREDAKKPFPVPALMLRPARENREDYDLVLVSDFGLLGGTRRCNEGYISSATAEGLRVGLIHYPRWGKKLGAINEMYHDLCYQDNVDLLTKEDRVRAPLVLIHHPPIMKYRMDMVPSIDCDIVAMLVNQSPMELWSEKPYLYDPQTVSGNCRHLFGKDPIWISISGRVHNTLESLGGYEPMLDRIWFPPFSGEVTEGHQHATDVREIRIGRHSRDHWTKWPASLKDTKAAYCANADGIEAHFLGGAKRKAKGFGVRPRNWNVSEFDTMPANDFLDDLDVFVNFMHHDYIEEFGRNTMEAMARGKPVILDHNLVDTFGDAGLYCDHAEVEQNVRRLMANPHLYKAQVAKGLEFVRKNCSQDTARKNLRDLIASAKRHNSDSKVAE